MEKLARGVHSFHTEYFSENRQLFERLATQGQRPETLFITCSDSRIIPDLLTGTQPGDLFTVRNVGNMVPHPTLPGGTAAAIEFAVEVLNVAHIVICGHTHCGAMEAVLDPGKMDDLPFLRKWLAQGERLGEIMKAYEGLDPEAKLRVAVEENVLVQLDHLREFPFVAKRLEAGTLRMSGWVYQLETGDVFAFDPVEEQFVAMTSGETRLRSTPPPPVIPR